MEQNGVSAAISTTSLTIHHHHHVSCELADASAAYKVASGLFLEMQSLKGKMPLSGQGIQFFLLVVCCQGQAPAGSNPRLGATGSFYLQLIFFFCVRFRSSDKFPFPLPDQTRCFFLFFVRSFVRPSIRRSREREDKLGKRKFVRNNCVCEHLPGKQRKWKI